MRLSGYARKMGVTWKTANRWFHAGQIPGAYQLP
jgi:predicted site-specific integrase-resolvase